MRRFGKTSTSEVVVEELRTRESGGKKSSDKVSLQHRAGAAAERGVSEPAFFECLAGRQ